MSEFWTGLYIKSEYDTFHNVLRSLHSERGFQEIVNERNSISMMSSFLRGKVYENLNNYSIYFWAYDRNTNWVYLFGQNDRPFPINPFVPDQIIQAVGEDAFYIGYLDTVSWWFYYFEQGKLISQFDSSPDSPLIRNNIELDTFDIRIKYQRENNQDKNSSIPSEILELYRGDIKKLIPAIIKADDANQAKKCLSIRQPEIAIGKFLEISKLKDYRYIWLYDVLDMISESSIDEIPGDYFGALVFSK